ncbi:hypothetical protein EJB05_00605, partial [Eragrostis curvula]
MSSHAAFARQPDLRPGRCFRHLRVPHSKEKKNQEMVADEAAAAAMEHYACNSPLKADIPLPLLSPSLPDLAATQNISRQGGGGARPTPPDLHICPTAVELAGGDPTATSRASRISDKGVADLSLDEPELEAVLLEMQRWRVHLKSLRMSRAAAQLLMRTTRAAA